MQVVSSAAYYFQAVVGVASLGEVLQPASVKPGEASLQDSEEEEVLHEGVEVSL